MHYGRLVSLVALLACAGCGGSSGGGPGASSPSSATPAPTTPVPTTPAPPASGPSTPDLRFGVQTHFAQGWPVSWAAVASGLSIATVRDELYWSVVEPTPGTYQFPSSYDGYMSALAKEGLSPLIEFDFENPNYDGGNTPYTDAGIAAYANYCSAVLAHYGGRIQAVEIWNEYNGTFNVGPATQDEPGTYARMLAQAYAQIKAKRPDVTIVGGSTAGVPLAYWQQLIADGALASMDALSIHPYRYNLPPEGVETQVAALQNLLRKYPGGQAKPIWVTEIGWLVQPGGDGQLAIDETTQAKYLVRAYALLLSAGVQRVYWYDLFDDPGSTGGLYLPDGTPRPSASAMRVMIGALSHATFVERETTADGVYSMLFSRPDGTELRVMWSMAPTALGVSGVTSATDLLGNALGVAGTLQLTDSPVFVTGPLSGLPPAPSESLLTDSTLDFSGTQGGNGWWYGYADGGGAFTQLPTYSVTNWTPGWTGPFPFLGVTPGDQHPSTDKTRAVSAVRRWVSAVSGTVHIVGQFQCENAGGDGTGVSVLVDGQPAVPRALIGGASPNVGLSFDFQWPVHAGSAIDFAVDPGPGLDINFDATAVNATISLMK